MLRKGLARSHSSELEVLHRFFDAAIIVVCFLLVAKLHDSPWNPHFSLIAIISVALFYWFAKKNNLYLSWRTASIWTETEKIIKSWILVILITLVLALFMNLTGAFFWHVFITWSLGGLIALCFWRACLRIILRQLRKHGRNKKFLAIAGAGAIGVRVASSILNNPWTGLEIIGVYDDFKPKGSVLYPGIDIHTSGSLDDLVEAAQLNRFDYIYIALPLKAEKRIIDLINKLSETNASIYIVPDLLMHDFLKAKIIEFGDHQIVNILQNPLHGKINWVKRFPHYIKRFVDFFFSLLIILCLSPVLLSISLLILLLEGPPILYKSVRYISENQKIYTIKFRTMIRNATDPKYKLKERFMRDGYLDIPLDCEIYTPIGRLLEKTQLVEILQLINIIFHGMSLVGNRPLPFDNLSILKKQLGWENRFKSPAGITGITQVIGKFYLMPQKRLELESLYSDVYLHGNILKCDMMIIYYTVRLLLYKKKMPIDEAFDLLNNCLKKTVQ